MITPAVASKVAQFYALGNTPAVNLARDLPQGLDANILLLGCGDLRNVLYTAYADTGFAGRQFDITCCDIEEGIIARNLVILSLIIDGGKTIDEELLWNASNHIHLSESDVQKVSAQARKLLDSSDSLSTWKSSKYGTNLPFCDDATLKDVRKLWSKYAEAGDEASHAAYVAASRAALQLSFEVRKERMGENPGSVLTGMRSAAPLSMESMPEVPVTHEHFWTTGVTGSRLATIPNPLIACYLSDSKLLHYGADPLLGFHLATAFAPLTETSPLRFDNEKERFKSVAAAKVQFRVWTDATSSLLAQKKLIIRSIVADAFAFCQTIQHWVTTGEEAAGWYRRQFDAQPLKLDTAAPIPKAFNAIDTSNLADHCGTINILISALPLLSPEPFSTLATETLLKGDGEADKELMCRLLCGHGPSMSLLLGVSLVEYWTNATSVSTVSETIVGVAGTSGADGRISQLHTRVSWKHASQFDGEGSSSTLEMTPDNLATILFQTCLKMFKHEDQITTVTAAMSDMISGPAGGYVHFHRGSFVALLKFVKARFPRTDFRKTYGIIESMIAANHALSPESIPDLAAQMYLHLQSVMNQPRLQAGVKDTSSLGSFNDWASIPAVVAVTVVVPRSFISQLYGNSAIQNFAAPTLIGSVTVEEGGSVTNRANFGDLQLTFGTVSEIGSRGTDDCSVNITADPAGWAGDSPLVASFFVLTSTLQLGPKPPNVGLELLATPQNLMTFRRVLGPDLAVYRTNLYDRERVYVTKFMAGHTKYPVYSGVGEQVDGGSIEESVSGGKSSFTAVVDDLGRVANITGHVDILSEKGNRLLVDKAPIELRQPSPFTIDIIFGKDALVLPLHFPYPVDSTLAKSRIARKSGYVEVLAPFADPLTTPALVDFVYPSVLARSTASDLVPLTLNSPRVSLDTLPIIDLTNKSALSWLTTLTYFQFSAQEKRAREQSLVSSNGLANSARHNFKESLLTMSTVAAGIQAQQTGLFAIDHPERGGIHMLLFVSSIRLDSAAGSIVLDAAALPFTMDLIASGVLTEFLLILGTLGMCSITVDDEELVLWKKVLPSLAERARNWSHEKNCEYKIKRAVPLSTKPGQPVLCSCGRGKLPKNFVALPEWDTAVEYVTRVAISPTYAVPLVEDVMDVKGIMNEDHTQVEQKAQQQQGDRCATCGATKAKDTKDGALKKCMQCHKVLYCGAECQKEDWKKHRRVCKASK